MSAERNKEPPPPIGTAGWVLGELAPMYARDTGGMTDDQRDAYLERRSNLTWLLAQQPSQDPRVLAAKLDILCTRLRRDLDPGCIPEPITDYLLAESIRADLVGLSVSQSVKES